MQGFSGSEICSSWSRHDFVYLVCEMPSWFEPKQLDVAGNVLSPAAVEFGCNASAVIGSREESTLAQWWSVSRILFTVRTLGTFSARDQLGPSHAVAGVASVPLRDVLASPRHRLEQRLELRFGKDLDGPIVGLLDVVLELCSAEVDNKFASELAPDPGMAEPLQTRSVGVPPRIVLPTRST